MTLLEQVAAEIIKSCDLRVEKKAAGCMAAYYVHHRPSTPIEKMIDMLKNAPGLDWRGKHNLTVRWMMRQLIEHLDGLYFVATFEHDRTAANSQ